MPKGPSLDPTQRRLAVHVEDHPLEYGTFEGTIPQGEYDGGTVMLWDRGTWEPLEDARVGYRKGHLKFELHGERLKGKWSLVRIHGRKDDDTDNWLLMKGKDRYATEDDPLDETTSVDSGRTMNEIAGNKKRSVWISNRKSLSKNARNLGTPRMTVAAQGNHSSRASVATNGRAERPKATKRGKVLIDPSVCINGRRQKQPADFQPQLATLVTRIPAGDQWLHELKLDGYRLLCFLESGKARLMTRNGNDWTRDFPTIAWSSEQLAVRDAILDGEAVVVRPDGTTDFQALQNAVKDKKVKTAAIRFFLFDLPHCDGFDLTRTPLIERKKVLKDILTASSDAGETLVYSEHVTGDGDKVFQAACAHAMEGVVSKQADAPYEQRRTRTWVKSKCLHEQEFVIGGFTDPNNSRKGFGALLLGFYQDNLLIYAGRVGTGFTQASLSAIHKQLGPLETKKPAFSNPPQGSEAKGVHWVRPHLVCEVEFNEWTREGILRHPSFKGLRADKDPKQIVRERPERVLSLNGNSRASGRKNAAKAKRSRRTPATKSKNASEYTSIARATSGDKAPSSKPLPSSKAKAEVRIAGVMINNSGRVLYPELGITKGELAAFYESIADWALPHIANRPLSFVRCPAGRESQCFFQKHLTDHMPAGIEGVPIREKSKTSQYVSIKTIQGLIGAVQMGVLEFHPWACRTDEIAKPDRLIFDLDPGPGVEWPQVIAGVKRLREILRTVKLESFLKTSGGKGLHVVAPIARTVTWDQLKEFAHGIVLAMAQEEPDRYLTVMTKARRPGKIFLDYLRNGRGATCVATYSTRAREYAPVSTPIFWEELGARLRPDKFNVRNLPQRLRSEKDPWAGFFTLRQTITASALRAVAALASI